MKIKVFGSTSKGSKDFELKPESKFGFNIQCEDGEGFVRFNNIQSFTWIKRGMIVYMDPSPIKGTSQYDFTRYESVKITRAKDIAKESFEHHYFK